MSDMARALPDISLLTAFIALFRCCSFTQAAREVGVTQSALSHRIRRLEEQIGYRLFERSTTNVQPTAAAEALHLRLEPLLTELEALFRQAGPPGPISLRVEMESSFARNWLTPRLGRFTARHPSVSIDLRIRHEGYEFGPGTSLAIRWGDGTWPGYRADWLMGMRLTPMCAPDYLQRHPLAQPRDLLDCILLHDRSTVYWAEWLRAAGVAGRPRHDGHVLHDTALLEHAVSHGQGVAMLAPSMRAADEGSRVMPFPDLSIEASGGYYILKPAPRLRGIAASFEAWLQEEAAGEPPVSPPVSPLVPPLG